MDKLRLGTGEELETSEVNASDNQLCFTAIGITDYTGFKAKLTQAAIADVKLYVGDNLANDFGKYVKIVYPIEIALQEDETMNVIVTLERGSDIEEKLEALENAVRILVLTGLGAL